MSDGRVYVYGVLDAERKVEVESAGVAAAPVRVIVEDGLGALVSDLDRDALSAAREVRAHWRVLEEVSARATVLPVRFGTVLEGDRAVREDLLAPHAERLAAQLRDLAGHVQVTVKGTYDEEGLLREIVAGSPAIAGLRERVQALPEAAGYHDRIRLGELISAEVERRRELDAAEVVARLEPLAAALHSEPAGRPNAAFDIALLVERTRLDAVSAAVGEVRERCSGRIDLRYIGPLPPYSFVDTELVAGGA